MTGNSRFSYRRLRNFAGFITVCGLLAGVAAGVVVYVRGLEYSSEATVLLSPRLSVDPSADPDASRTLETEARVAVSDVVLVAASDESDLTVVELKRAVTATAVTNTRLVHITAVGPSPDVARDRAGAVVAAYQQYRVEAQGQEALDYGAYVAAELARIEQARANPGTPAGENAALDSERERLLTDLEVVRSMGRAPTGGVTIADPPSLPDAWSAILAAVRDVVLAVLLGLLVGAAIAIYRTMTNGTILSARDVEELSELRVLGEVELPAPRTGTAVDGSRAADIALSTAPADVADLRRAMAVRKAHCLVVAGVGEPSAAMCAAARLGAAAAASGTSVLLISSDQNGDEFFGVRGADRPGLAAVVAGRASLDETLVAPDRTGVPNLSLVPYGAGGTALAVLSSGATAMLLREASRRWELVVMVCTAADAPLVAVAADACVLAVTVDGTVASQITRAERELADAGVPVLGALLARAPHRRGSSRRRTVAPQRSAASRVVRVESGA